MQFFYSIQPSSLQSSAEGLTGDKSFAPESSVASLVLELGQKMQQWLKEFCIAIQIRQKNLPSPPCSHAIPRLYPTLRPVQSSSVETGANVEQLSSAPLLHWIRIIQWKTFIFQAQSWDSWTRHPAFCMEEC